MSPNAKQTLNGMMAALAFACIGLVAITWASLQPDPKDEFVGLVYPFSYSQQDVLHAISHTDLKPIRFGRTDNVVIVAAPSTKTDDIIKFTGALMAVNASNSLLCASS